MDHHQILPISVWKFFAFYHQPSPIPYGTLRERPTEPRMMPCFPISSPDRGGQNIVANGKGKEFRSGGQERRSGIEAIAKAIQGMLLVDPLETIRQTTVLTNRFGMTSWVEFKPT